MKRLPGSICSGNHSVRMFSSATMAIPSSLVLGTRKNSSSCPGSVLRTSSARAGRRLFLHWSGAGHLRPYLSHRIAQAYTQQRLARVLQDVNDLALSVLHINAPAVRQQALLGASPYG